MQQADAQFDATASRIANLPFPAVPGAQSNPPDNLELSANIVSLLQSRNYFDANAKVAHVADDIQKSTLNILG
jgi:hypothetical protein